MTEFEWKELTDTVFEDWVRIGVKFTGTKPSADEPLVEGLIAQTSIVCRKWPRLMDVMAGLVQLYGDLLNVSLMRKYIPHGDSAVIGLLCDLVTSREAEKIKLLTKYCAPKETPEFLFPENYLTIDIVEHMVPEETRKICRKWNLYFPYVRIKTNCMLIRKDILSRNPNLAHRVTN